MNRMTSVFPIYLERLDPTQQMAHFYWIGVEPTLFGDWATVCRWGRIGAFGQRQEQWFTTREHATAAAQAVLARKRQRGYRTPAEWHRTGRPAAINPKRPSKANAASANRSQYELALD